MIIIYHWLFLFKHTFKADDTIEILGVSFIFFYRQAYITISSL